MSDNITLPREVAQLALDALHYAARPPSGDGLYAKEIAILRAALAAEQQKQEPVAWRPRLSPNLCFHWSRPWSEGVPSEQTVDYWNQKGAGVEYAYAAPPDAEALRRDAERWRFYEAAGSNLTLRLHNTRSDHRNAVIDAAMQENKR